MARRETAPRIEVFTYHRRVSRRLRQVAAGVLAALLAWILALAAFGLFGDGCVEDRVEDRLAESMRAKVSLGDADIGLVTGMLALRDLRLERVERGTFRLHVQRVDVDLLPLGLVLFQDEVGDVTVRGVDVELSALAALDFRGARREPVTFARFELRDAHVALEATSALPWLALVDLTIERAVAGRTTLRTPMSWVFALEDLKARLELPGGLTASLTYERGLVRVAGGLFGDDTIEIPLEIPVLEPARELEQLAEMGRQLASELAKRVSSDQIQRRIRDEIRNRF